MNGSISALERLVELKNQGALTEDEFEEQKRRLLQPDATELGEVEPSMPSSRSWRTSAVVGMAILSSVAVGAFVFTKQSEIGSVGAATNSDLVAGDGSEVETADDAEVHTDGSAWQIEETVDPMSDATLTVATARIPGSLHNFKVNVSCSSEGRVEYVITSFDKAGEPSEMRRSLSTNGWAIPFQYRVDDERSVDWAVEPEYTNEIKLKPPSFLWTGDIARASRARFRLYMMNTEETIEVDQTDEALRGVLAPCIAKQEQARAEHEARMRASEEEAEAPQTDDLLTNGM